MQVNAAASALLKSRIVSSKEIFCRSLFLSARWFVFSDCARKGLHCIILPNSEAAEYCANDLYNLIEGDKVFFLPASGDGVDSNLFNPDSGGRYWSSTPYPYMDAGYAYGLYFGSGQYDFGRWDGCARYDGRSVRPVQDAE